MSSVAAVGYKLSHECLPAHEGGVKGLAVLSDDVFVSGSDDNMATVHKRIGNTREFVSIHTCPEHSAQVRSIVAIPPCSVLPTGGFATGCLDKLIRIYSFDPTTTAVVYIRTLSGHTGGVISLTMSASGDLVSGSWDGTARIWDLNGTMKQNLAGHENGCSVCVLDNGDIVVGSTGRKDEYDRPCDFKLRIWSRSGGSDQYSIKKVIEDHELSIRDVQTVPGVGFISAANDGTVKLRDNNGNVLQSVQNPLANDGHPVFCYSAHYVKESRTLYTCSDDCVLRVYVDFALVDSFSLPGTPWKARTIGNQLVVVTDQNGTSRRGHVYLFISPSTGGAASGGVSLEGPVLASELEMATFEKDLAPPPKQPTEYSGSGDKMKINGLYEARNTVIGRKEGEYGFFRLPSGAIMLCTWSASAGTWMDVGEVMDKEEGSQNIEEQYDYVRQVMLDTPGGQKTLTLCWNEDDDVVSVAKDFVQKNNLHEESYEEVRNFIIENKMKAGGAGRVKSSAAAPSTKNLPGTSYISSDVTDFTKLWAKFNEENSKLSSPIADNDLTALTELFNVLSQPARYHSSKSSPEGLKVLISQVTTKLTESPSAGILTPLLDLMRFIPLHQSSVDVLFEQGNTKAGLTLLQEFASLVNVSLSRPVALLLSRFFLNCSKIFEARRTLLTAFALEPEAGSGVSAATAVLLGYPHASVRETASGILSNVGVSVASSESSKLVEKSVAAAAAEKVAALGIKFLEAGAGAAEKPSDDAVRNVLVGIGSVVATGFSKDYISARKEVLSSFSGGANESLYKELVSIC